MLENDKKMIKSDFLERGYEIENINDLLNISSKEKDLIPYLLHLLDYFKDEKDKEFIVRCLGVKGFKEAIPRLLEEFKNAKENHYRWAIGNSINIIHSMSIEKELIELSMDKKYGTGRQMLVLSLGYYKTDLSIKCLTNLLKDEEVRGHAIQALGKCGRIDSIADIEAYCNSNNRWIKSEAIKAVKRIERRYGDKKI